MSLFRVLRSLAAVLGVLVAGPVLAQETGALKGRDVSIPMLASRPGGKPAYVTVSIGAGPASTVSVDTGSTGLYVFKRQIGPDVRLTDRPIHQSYVDGTNFRGVIGLARVRFTDADGFAETRTMAVGVITDVSCAASRPDCPGDDRKPGVMGVGMDTGGRLASPLAQLQGPGADGFVVDMRRGGTPRLLVGPSAAALRGFRFAALKPGRPGTIGLPSWDSGSATGTFGIDGRPGLPQPVIFDTGQFDTVFDAGPDASPRLGPHNFLLPGQTVSLVVPGALSLRIETDRSMFIMPRATPRANAGALLFRYVAVAFDARNGRIGFLQEQ